MNCGERESCGNQTIEIDDNLIAYPFCDKYQKRLEIVGFRQGMMIDLVVKRCEECVLND